MGQLNKGGYHSIDKPYYLRVIKMLAYIIAGILCGPATYKWGAGSIGKRTIKVVPLPISVSKVTVPP